ncbi:glycosyl hydrolase, partial [bacterium]|nr:glycosyl hydrolase [bacterium]
RASGERISIQPQPGADGEPLKWNWDSALIISPHLNTRLYFAANKLFRSDDRGNSWRAVSPDLTRQLDRNQLEIMGRVWPVDAVAKNNSTSFYGTIVSLAESPLMEGLIYVGTDDGLIQVTEDGGGNWRRIDKLPGVPELSYVSDVETSLHDPNTVYASFDNHKAGDFKPYLFKSTDRGKSWKSISSDLPERGTVYALAEDHKQPSLLFVGTEFGVFFTVDDGQKWTQLKSGLPTIAVRDLTIQRRENDLVLGTFGRGFYILDDYSPLRSINAELLEKEAELFTVKDAWMYMQDTPLGRRGKSFQGDSFYTADNPPFGAIFTYYLKDELKTRKKMRQEKEKKAAKNGGTASYPTWDELRAEAREEKPAIVFTVRDEDGSVVRRLTGSTKSGIHRIAWDLRYPPATPTRLGSRSRDSFRGPATGPMTVPGTYTVAMARHIDGQEFPLGSPQTFTLKPLGTATLPAEDPEQLLTFQRKIGSLQRAVLGASRAANDALDRIKHIKKAIIDTPEADPALAVRAKELAIRLDELMIKLNGDRIIRSHSEPAPPSITSRVQEIVRGHWNSTSVATQTFLDLYEIASSEFAVVLEELRVLVEQDLEELEAQLESVGAPWTPGRVPIWTRK